MNIKKMVESRRSELVNEQNAIVKRWSEWLTPVNEYLKKHQGRELGIHEARATAQCLDNAIMHTGVSPKALGRLFEATTEDNISFLGVQLPIIAALLPSLVLNEVALVQSLDRRTGSVFYLDVKYDTTKGAVTAGDTMLSSTTGTNRTQAGQLYAYAGAWNEGIASSGSKVGGNTVTHTCTFKPGITSGTVSIVSADGVILGTDADTSGVITGTGGTGTINYTSGVVSFTLSTTTDSDGLMINYRYQYDLPVDANDVRSGVPKASISLTQSPMTAIDFPLAAEWSVGAAVDLSKAHGLDLESELVRYLGGEVQFTIDHFGINMIDLASHGGSWEGTDYTPATAITAWDAEVGSGQEWVFKKQEILDRFEEGSNNIFEATLRAQGSFIICGSNVARVIRQLPTFKAKSIDLPLGPMVIGDIGGRTIIQDPLLQTRTIDSVSVSGTNRYIMGYRGKDFLHAAFAYAPYMPLFASPTVTTADLHSQKGFMSAAGFKVLNSQMFTYGKISNLGA